jgi:tetratricopeptide (TPR) repeat protein
MPLARCFLVLVTLLVQCCVTACVQKSAFAQESAEETVRYFDGLRQRRLFSLAESVCLGKLEDRSLSVNDRSSFTVELSRTFAEHARFVSGIDEQRDLLKRAQKVVMDLIEANPNHPQQLLLRSQLIIVGASQVESYRWRFELTPNDETLSQRAVGLGQELVPQFEKLEKDMGNELRRPFRDPAGQKLKPFQLRGLQRVVRFRLANLLLNMAQVLGRESPDRAEALVKADEWFRKLAGGDPAAMITWRSQIGLVKVTRLRRDTEGLARMLNALSRDSPPAVIRDEIVAEAVQLLVDQTKLTEAAEMLREYRLEHKRLSGRLCFLNAQVLLEMRRVAVEHKEDALAEQLMEQVVAFVVRARTESDSFWAARAQQLLAGASSSQKYGPKIAALLRQGKEKFASGDAKRAAELYEQAFNSAKTDGDTDVAVELGYTLGSMLLQMQSHDAASQIFAMVVKLDAKNPRAPDADILRIFALGKMYAKEPTRFRREAYTRALEVHRTQFKTAATAAEATWMLAQLEERRLQFTTAINLYLAIPTEHHRGPAAHAGAARCGQAVLQRLKKLQKPTEDWETAVSERLAELAAPLVGQTEALSFDESELLLITSRILLTKTKPEFQIADKFLAQLLSTTQPPLDPDTDKPAYIGISKHHRQTAMQLRMVTYASRGQMNEARELLRQLEETGVDNLFAVLSSLNSASTGLDANSQRNLGQLQLDTIRASGVQLESLNPATQKKFLLAMGNAHEMAQQALDAARHYELLLAQQPKDYDLIKKIAQLHMTSNAPADLTVSKQKWQTLEAHEKPGTIAWLEARLESLVCMQRLRQTAECNKKLKLTRLLYPTLGNETLKKRFDALEKLVSAN